MLTTKKRGTTNPFAKDPKKRCPRCGESGDMYVRDVMNKLSRADNKTYICGPCGTAEALDPISMGAPWKLMDNPISIGTMRRIAKRERDA